jgi:predicted RNA-binding Zn-ribbon protein involved in translation (DUF1610 family)
MVRCPSCGQQNAVGSDVCSSCGVDLNPDAEPE